TTPVQAGLCPPGGPCPGAYNGRAALHLARLFTPRQDPHGAGSLIRDVSGEGDPGAKGQWVHVDTAHDVSVASKRAFLITAERGAPTYFLFPAACWRLSTRSSRRRKSKLSMLAAFAL